MNGGCSICVATCVNAGKDMVGTNCPDCIPNGSKTGNYTVMYHPEGWRDAKTEQPEEDGWYYCANADKKEWAVILWENGKWVDLYAMRNPPVTHWQPLPTPPWEVMP